MAATISLSSHNFIGVRNSTPPKVKSFSINPNPNSNANQKTATKNIFNTRVKMSFPKTVYSVAKRSDTKFIALILTISPYHCLWRN